MRPIRLLVAGDPKQRTGGYIYDARIAQSLTHAGSPVETIGLSGRFPNADTSAANALASTLADCPDGDTVVVDGLVLGGLPEVVAEHAHRLCLIALIHHPLADESGLDSALGDHLFATEQRALSLATHIIVTSPFTARRLIHTYGVDPNGLDIVEPGLDKPLASPCQPVDTPHLLCIASLIPRKGHAVLIEALSQIIDLTWRCDCIGDVLRNPACADEVRAAIRTHGLGNRVHLAGSQPPEVLAAAYRAARLFVLPSYYEGYGMVITEALAYGLPVITTTGGALAETLAPDAGIAVPPGDAEALADALRRLLSDPETHTQLSTGARRAANALHGWDEAGAQFAAVIDRLALP